MGENLIGRLDCILFALIIGLSERKVMVEQSGFVYF